MSELKLFVIYVSDVITCKTFFKFHM